MEKPTWNGRTDALLQYGTFCGLEGEGGSGEGSGVEWTDGHWTDWMTGGMKRDSAADSAD